MDVTHLAQQVALDLEAGAEWVIVEGRESGQGVVIYDEKGRIKPGELEAMAAAADPGLLLWEAPNKAQQQELILRFGPEVNLGNVAPGDVLALEALRVGHGGIRSSMRCAGGTGVGLAVRRHNLKPLSQLRVKQTSRSSSL